MGRAPAPVVRGCRRMARADRTETSMVTAFRIQRTTTWTVMEFLTIRIPTVTGMAFRMEKTTTRLGQILTVTVREGSRKMALAMGKATGPEARVKTAREGRAEKMVRWRALMDRAATARAATKRVAKTARAGKKAARAPRAAVSVTAATVLRAVASKVEARKSLRPRAEKVVAPEDNKAAKVGSPVSRPAKPEAKEAAVVRVAASKGRAARPVVLQGADREAVAIRSS